MDYVLKELPYPPKLNLFGHNTEFFEFDLYWIVYEPTEILFKDVRKELKEEGWMLQRHSRTNKEMWVYDKVDWEKTKNEVLLPVSYNGSMLAS